MADAADRNLDPRQFPDLNRAFYRARPDAYLHRRLVSLLLCLGCPEELAALLGAGVQVGEMKYTSDDEFTEDERRDYATTELVVLGHHASEALLRLFLAHEGLPACPWLELSRLRGPAQFKKRIDDLRDGLSDPGQRERIAVVLLGGIDQPTAVQPRTTSEVWEGHVDAAVSMLGLCSNRILDQSAMYNAAKHGLAVISGPSGVALGSEDAPFPLDVAINGPSLSYLERSPATAETPPRWQRATSWVHTEAELVSTFFVIRQIETLWSLARARYTDEVGGTIHPLTADQIVHSIPKMADSPYLIRGFGMSLLYYEPETSGG